MAMSDRADRTGRDVLAELFGDREAFLRDHWDRVPLYCPAQVKATDLLSTDAVDELISSQVLYWPVQLRLAKEGKILDPELFTAGVQYPGLTNPPLAADPAAVVEQFLDGASILLQGLHRVWPPIGELCRELDTALTHNSSAGAFLTPPFAQGLPAHFDAYDVIIIQVEGRKHWDLFAPPVEYPLEGGPDLREDPGPPDIQLEMAPGDVLYLPQGWIHAVRSLDEVSLHISVMVGNRRWLSLVETVLADIGDDVELRRSVPAGYAHDPDALVDDLTQKLEGLKAWLDTRDLGAVARGAAYEFWATRRPSRRHQLAQAIAADAIDDLTLVRGRAPGNLQVFEDATTVTLLLGQRRMTVPVAFAAPLRRLAAGQPIVVADLADQLTDELRLPLVRQLVREGYLEVIDNGLDLLGDDRGVDGDDGGPVEGVGVDGADVDGADLDAAPQDGDPGRVAPPVDLSSLVGLSIDALREDWFGQRPLVVAGAAPTRFGHLLDLAGVEQLILRHHRDRAARDGGGRLRERVRLDRATGPVEFELYHRAVELPEGQQAVLDLERLAILLQQGCRVTVHSVDELDEGRAQLTGAVADGLGRAASMRAVATWSAGEQPVERVAHHQFVLHLAGRRSWTVTSPGGEEASADDRSAALDPGDVLYVPSGWRAGWVDAEAPALHLVIDVAADPPNILFEHLRSTLAGLDVLRADLPVLASADEQAAYVARVQAALVATLATLA
jgi:lysine-specific demethylase/histidyl-hydroxylase NO66